MQTDARHSDHGVQIVASDAVQSLKRSFPDWVCWYGPHTRTWWGMSPPSYWYPPLVEAATAGELALRVRQLKAVERRVTQHSD